MRHLIWKLAALVLIGGCAIDFWVPGDPPEEDVMIGGIGDMRPYFGALRTLADPEAGEFMLATCGCGDWRVLLESDDGERWQFPVQFYSTMPGNQDEPVMLFGREEEHAAIGTLLQSSGRLSGRAEHGARLYSFTATRGVNHTDNASACVKCHIGDDPVWPQPPAHPAFELNPPNCLSCHTVTINR